MKSITVIPNRMTLCQRIEAYWAAEKHQKRYSHIKHHVHTGKNGKYKVTNLKSIRVELT